MKKIRVLTIASIFLLALLGLSMVCASENITEELSDTNDEPIALDENQSIKSAPVSGDNFENIQTSVDNSKAGDVIELNGTYSGYNAIIVSKSLTFKSTGSPATLNATSSRIFYIQGGDVTFKNIIFANGWDDNGGAIYSKGNCIFENCVFKNNKAEVGGAIYSIGSVTLTKTTFENNAATSYGGAVCCDYLLKKDASKSNRGDVDVNGCTFTGNTAKDGGAIAVIISYYVGGESKYCNLKIKNSNFNKNKASEDGGAVFFNADKGFGGKLTVDKSNFTQNAAKEGSAICLLECSGTITNSNFNKNTADFASVYAYNEKFTIKKCNFDSNSAEYVSGVMFSLAKASIVDSTFKSNNGIPVSSDSNSELKVTQGTSTKTYDTIIALSNSLKRYTSITVKAIKTDMSATYGQGVRFYFQVIDKTTNKPIPYYSLCVSFMDGKKGKTLHKTTDKDGKFNQYVGTRLDIGNYKVTYSSNGDWGLIDNAEHTLKIKKVKPVVKAPVVKAKYKKYNIFKVSVKNSKNEPVTCIKVKMKVYTGKKAKTYTVKTNINGNAKLNTKKFSKGTHKVVIKSANKNYSFSLKSKIIIK